MKKLTFKEANVPPRIAKFLDTNEQTIINVLAESRAKSPDEKIVIVAILDIPKPRIRGYAFSALPEIVGHIEAIHTLTADQIESLKAPTTPPGYAHFIVLAQQGISRFDIRPVLSEALS